MRWTKDINKRWSLSNNDIVYTDFKENLKSATDLDIVLSDAGKAVVYVPTHNIHDVHEWYRIFKDSHEISDDFDKHGYAIHGYFNKARSESIRGWFPNLIEVKATSSSHFKYVTVNILLPTTDIDYTRYSVDFMENFTNISQLIVDGTEVFNEELVLLMHQSYETLTTYPIFITRSSKNKYYIINSGIEKYFKIGNKCVVKDINKVYHETTIVDIQPETTGLINYLIITTSNIIVNPSKIGDITSGVWVSTTAGDVLKNTNGVYQYLDNNLTIVADMHDKYKTYNQIIYTYQGLTNQNKEFYLRRNENILIPGYGHYPVANSIYPLIYSLGETCLVKYEIDYNLDTHIPAHPTTLPPYDITTNAYRLLFLDNTMADKILATDNNGIGSYKHVGPNINDAGFTWTTRTSAINNNWSSVSYGVVTITGIGVFVAVAGSGINNRIMTSPDGITWTSRTAGTSAAANRNWTSVTYGIVAGVGIFVAVAFNGDIGDGVMTSLNGINWTIRASATNNKWTSVTYGNNLFVAVARSGINNRIMTSPDGINWTSRTSAANNFWLSVTYGNSLFVAVSSGEIDFNVLTIGTTETVMTSSNGIDWAISTNAPIRRWRSITYGDGLFVAVANSGAGSRAMTSSNGINWNTRLTPNNSWNSVIYGNGMFVAVAFDGTNNRVMTSPEGIVWTLRTSATNNIWTGVSYGNGIFVAVASSGLDNRVMTSSDTATTISDVIDMGVTGNVLHNIQFLPTDINNKKNVLDRHNNDRYYLSGVVKPNYNFRHVNRGGFKYNIDFINGISGTTYVQNTDIIQNVETSTIISTYNTELNSSIFNTDTFAIGDFVNLSYTFVDAITNISHIALTEQFLVINRSYTTNNISIVVFPKLDDNFVDEFKSFSQSLQINQPITNTNIVTLNIDCVNIYDRHSSVYNTTGTGLMNAFNKTIIGHVYDYSCFENNNTTLLFNGIKQSHKHKWENHGTKINVGTPVVEYLVDHEINKDHRIYFKGYYTIDNFIKNYLECSTTNVITLAQMSDIDNTNFYYNNILNDPDRFGIEGSIKIVGNGNIIYFGSNYKEIILDNIKPDTLIQFITPSANMPIWVSKIVWHDDRNVGTITTLNVIPVLSPNILIKLNVVRDITAISSMLYEIFGREINQKNNPYAYDKFTTLGMLPEHVGMLVPYTYAAYKPDTSSYAYSMLNYAYNPTLPDQVVPVLGIWTNRTSAAYHDWYGVTFGNNIFVAVSVSESRNQVMTSTNGITWVLRSNPSINYNLWVAVTYGIVNGNGLFVAISTYNSVNANERVMTSPDGINWTIRTTPGTVVNQWNSVTYGLVNGIGLFVVVSSNNPSGPTNRVMTSIDGTNWLLYVSQVHNQWSCVTYGLVNGVGLFVAVATSGTTLVMTSPNGVIWTSQSTGVVANQWSSVTYGNGLFVAVAVGGVNNANRVMTSTDGITWNGPTNMIAANNGWTSVTYSNGFFVAVSYNGINRSMTSPDGIVWTTVITSSSGDNDWLGVTYGNNLFVAVARTGNNNRVMTLPISTNIISIPASKNTKLLKNLTGIVYKEFNEPRISLLKRDKNFMFTKTTNTVTATQIINVKDVSLVNINILATVAELGPAQEYVLVNGDKILLLGQNDNTQNGVYVFNSITGMWVAYVGLTIYTYILVDNAEWHVHDGWMYSVTTLIPLKTFTRVYSIPQTYTTSVTTGTEKMDMRLTMTPIEVAKLGVNNKTQSWKKIDTDYDILERFENIVNIQKDINK